MALALLRIDLPQVEPASDNAPFIENDAADGYFAHCSCPFRLMKGLFHVVNIVSNLIGQGFSPLSISFFKKYNTEKPKCILLLQKILKISIFKLNYPHFHCNIVLGNVCISWHFPRMQLLGTVFGGQSMNLGQKKKIAILISRGSAEYQYTLLRRLVSKARECGYYALVYSCFGKYGNNEAYDVGESYTNSRARQY